MKHIDFYMDIIQKKSSSSGGGGITPAGTKEITANGKHDVTAFAEADVQVPAGVSQEKYDSLLETYRPHSTTYTFENEDITELKDFAFAYDVNISSARLTNLTSVGESAFEYCRALREFHAEKLQTGDISAFASANLSQAIFPELTTVAERMFENCGYLKKIKCDKAIGLNSRSIRGCANLVVIDIYGGDVLSSPADNPLNALKSLVLRNAEKVTGTYSLSWIPSTASIYVADDLVEQYKTATNWSSKAEQIKPLSTYVEV